MSSDPKVLSPTTAMAVGKQRAPNGVDRVMLVILRDDVLQITQFMTADQACQLAEQLLTTAAEIKTGLVLPSRLGVQAG